MNSTESVLFTAKSYLRKFKKNFIDYEEFYKLCVKEQCSIDNLIDKGYIYIRVDGVHLTDKALLAV